jgi:hypothetical protein
MDILCKNHLPSPSITRKKTFKSQNSIKSIFDSNLSMPINQLAPLIFYASSPGKIIDDV